MTSLTVSTVMTPDPVTVRTDTPLKEIAEVLTARAISAVGVLDRHGALVGVVSEADLLSHLREHERPSWLAKRLSRRDRRMSGRVASDLMTAPALTIDAGASLTAASAEFARTGVRRLFVLRRGALVGVVSRSDLVRVFVRTDDELLHEVERGVLLRALGLGPDRARVAVHDGVVTMCGRVEKRSEVETLTRMVEDVPGVVAVENRLDYVWNDVA
ncbi:CBS domain-containing protein [Amycolatopsis sp. CA-230715]|uniref:CBS domain-containing protein n=1 Tax=Amycolatopsis sp. CA-230715 TaxID=2745196 RepID=UPI001C025CBA|nr:CBS domain-containing protein [Amycolatopsis sp. CA-230715]QWF77958.1 hypothetical protein HUW46_01351 [Amycolatopsis sp. CA-230715]